MTDPSLPEATPQWKQFWTHQRENLQILFLAIVLAVSIRAFIAEPRYIPSDSMLPTLAVGDRLVVEKVSYKLRPPHRQEIIVFEPPPQLQRFGYNKNQAFIKRIIGEPLDIVAVHQGQVFVNQEPLAEDYLLDPPRYEWGPYQVPAGQLLVMGDNRNNSNDSHIWGFLPQDNILGRAWIRFWPLDRIDWL